MVENSRATGPTTGTAIVVERDLSKEGDTSDIEIGVYIDSEENDWEDGGTALNMSDKRRIVRERMYWIAAHHFGFDTRDWGNQTAEGTHTVDARWASPNTYVPRSLTISTSPMYQVDDAVREAFEAQAGALIMGRGSNAVWKFKWGRGDVTMTLKSLDRTTCDIEYATMARVVPD